jgi:UDP-galactopyranose mutase
MRTLIVGAGFTGAVIARELAERHYPSLVIDQRSHVGGNCHTEHDRRTGIMVHVYGPHIFHTDREDVWTYVTHFAEMVPYVNRVKAVARGRVYSLPINLHTINQFFGTTLTPDEARDFIDARRDRSIETPRNFEEQALVMIGRELYETFFRGYTMKQWGVDPSRLPPSILKRLPLRFNYDDNYFSHKYQGMPRLGYTRVVRQILRHPNIEVRTRCDFETVRRQESWRHVVYSGPLDSYFQFEHGRLGYRTLDFEMIYRSGDAQGTAVVNYCDEDIPFTRVSEHKHFSPWEAGKFEETVVMREYSRSATPADIPYYPLHLVDDRRLLATYVRRARLETGVTFAGRLGTYSYLDMDVSIARALETAQLIVESFQQDLPPPSFVHSPAVDL